MRRYILFCFVVLAMVPFGLEDSARAQPSDAIIEDCLETTVREPSQRLQMDPFFDKYTDAQGIPVVASGDVPDRGLLVARDVILHMLKKTPSIQQHMIVEGYKLGVMADTDSTMDIPWYRDLEKPDGTIPNFTSSSKGYILPIITSRWTCSTSTRRESSRPGPCCDTHLDAPTPNLNTRNPTPHRI